MTEKTETMESVAGTKPQIVQQLTIVFRGGHTENVQFGTQSPDELNPQVEDFLRACADPAQKNKSFLFQGARIIFVRLEEVAGASVMSFIANPDTEGKA